MLFPSESKQTPHAKVVWNSLSSTAEDLTTSVNSTPQKKQQQYYVVVSEWGSRALVVVRASSTTAAEIIAKHNARKELGWEGIYNVYYAFPVDSLRKHSLIRNSQVKPVYFPSCP